MVVDFTAEQTDARLSLLDDARGFFIQVWRDNPELLSHADPKLVEMMRPVWDHDRAARTASLEIA